MHPFVNILSTKRLPANLKHFLLNADFGILEADFIETTSQPFVFTTLHDNLIITSQNAVESLLKNNALETIKTKKCFCVGSKTKEMLEKNQFTVVASTDYAKELANIICEKHKNESFTFFSGNLRFDTLPMALQNTGITFNEIQVYTTRLTPVAIEGNYNGVLFFSPSGVESYLKKNKLTDQICFCIGTTTAKALDNQTKKIVLAHKPTIENTITQCINYYKTR